MRAAARALRADDGKVVVSGEEEEEEDSEEKELEDIVWGVGRGEGVGSEGRVGCVLKREWQLPVSNKLALGDK